MLCTWCDETIACQMLGFVFPDPETKIYPRKMPPWGKELYDLLRDNNPECNVTINGRIILLPLSRVFDLSKHRVESTVFHSRKTWFTATEYVVGPNNMFYARRLCSMAMGHVLWS